MNKRQAKKASRKVTYPIVDEMNLLTLSPEEYKVAIQDFEKYVHKYCRYKHYKDRGKIRRKNGRIVFPYYFPVGAAYKEWMSKMLSSYRSYKIDTQIVLQSIEQLKEKYPEATADILRKDEV